MISALDHPYCGDLGLSVEPYQLIDDQLMKPNDAAATNAAMLKI